MFRRKKKQSQSQARASRITERERASVFSYHSSRSRPETSSGRFQTTNDEVANTSASASRQANNSQSPWRHIPTAIGLLLISVSIVYALILTTNPQIVPLAVSTPSLLRETDEYQKGVQKILAASPWNRLKLTISSEKVANEIRAQFPELTEVSVNIPLLGKRPIIQISPADPTLILQTETGDYVLDKQGVALMRLSELPSLDKFDLTTVNDQVGMDVTMGQHALPTTTVTFIEDIIFQFEKNDIKIASIRLPAVANEVHVQPEGQSYYLKFNIQNDVLQQTGSYFALVKDLQQRGQPQPKEYVDLRIDGRAYYK